MRDVTLSRSANFRAERSRSPPVERVQSFKVSVGRCFAGRVVDVNFDPLNANSRVHKEATTKTISVSCATIYLSAKSMDKIQINIS